MAAPRLYALPGYNGATMLHRDPGCTQWVAVTKATLAEGEVWQSDCYGPSYRVTWARMGDVDRALADADDVEALLGERALLAAE